MTIAELRKLYEASSPGEWNADRCHDTEADIGYVDATRDCLFRSHEEVALLATASSNDRANASFIAAAHNAMPGLLAVAESAMAVLATSDLLVTASPETVALVAGIRALEES